MEGASVVRQSAGDDLFDNPGSPVSILIYSLLACLGTCLIGFTCYLRKHQPNVDVEARQYTGRESWNQMRDDDQYVPEVTGSLAADAEATNRELDAGREGSDDDNDAKMDFGSRDTDAEPAPKRKRARKGSRASAGSRSSAASRGSAAGRRRAGSAASNSAGRRGSGASNASRGSRASGGSRGSRASGGRKRKASGGGRRR